MEIPNFLLEMSRQMNEDENRATAHPFWQVKCKRHIVTEQGYNEAGFVICSDEGEVFRSWIDDESDFYEYLSEYYPEWLSKWFECEDVSDSDSKKEIFEDSFGLESGDLPDDLNRVFVQVVEEVVTTHLTKSDAEGFINRKQHDYPKLYTYVESAYWSPQLRELQDWIKTLQPAQNSKRKEK